MKVADNIFKLCFNFYSSLANQSTSSIVLLQWRLIGRKVGGTQMDLLIYKKPGKQNKNIPQIN